MAVLCPHCQKESQDDEFCDWCNRELPTAVQAEAAPPESAVLRDGTMLDLRGWSNRWPDDPDAEQVVEANGRPFRVCGFSPRNWTELREQVETRAQAAVACLPQIEIVESEGGAVLAVEAGAASFELPSAIPRNYDDDWIPLLRSIAGGIDRLATALTPLHEAGCVWLNFDPTAVEAKGDDLLLTNLDWRLFPAGRSPSALSISPLYSAPEVCSFAGDRIGPRTDVYHLGILAYLLVAGLPRGFAGGGLAAFSHRLPNLRTYQFHLPPGIAPVIAQATSIDPQARFASVREFADAFAGIVAEVERRYAEAPASMVARVNDEPETRESLGSTLASWTKKLFGGAATVETEALSGSIVDIGGACRAGRAKEALGAVNQDAIAFATEGEGVYAIVADGVTNAVAGRGELASAAACSATEAALRNSTEADFDAFREHALRATIDGSQGLIAQAIELYSGEREEADGVSLAEAAEAESTEDSSVSTKPDVEPLSELRDSDLMSSTIVAATWRAGRLHLFSLGDSRAYLVTDRYIDQLTVDGDVGATLLAEEAPPEQVQAMGAAAKALQRCFGAAQRDDRGDFVVDPERCTPSFARFPTLPGETIVLCSDGLVDEGIFLEPADAARLVRENRGAIAQEIAEALVAAADERQRPPSSAEPNGFGDNIACIVIKTPDASGPLAENANDG